MSKTEDTAKSSEKPSRKRKSPETNTAEDAVLSESSETKSLDKLSQRIVEGSLIALTAICLILILALATYNGGDPGWSTTGSGVAVQNAVGTTGAWLGDVFYSVFGYLAYLFPFMLMYRAFIIFRDRHVGFHPDWVLVGIRVVGFILVMVGSTGLLTIHSGIDPTVLPFGDGGWLGKTIAEACFSSFGLIGARILLLSVFLFGMTIFTDLSWIRLMDELGRMSTEAIEQFKVKRVEKAEAKAQEELEAAKAPPVKVEPKVTAPKPVTKPKTATEEAEEKKSAIPKIKIPKIKIPEIKEPAAKPKPSPRAEKAKQKKLFDTSEIGELPSLDLLNPAEKDDSKGYSEESLAEMSQLLEARLLEFKVTAEVVSVMPGPVVTRFEIQPAAGTKASKISGLASDLARSLAVEGVRVVEVIPGKPYIGIEIPNESREMVCISEVLCSEEFEKSKSPLAVALGHDIAGKTVIADLAKMPHLLVAGTTGSGKSVGVNAMILSILCKSTPEEVRMIMVDPKMLELSIYDGIPHLLTPVITDMKDASNGLRWCVGEMERRYKLMSLLQVRNLEGFNKKVKAAIDAGEPIPDPLWNPGEEFEAGEDVPPAPGLETLPAVVVIIDEFADMMMVVGKKVEELIARIAQKARAAGIHLVLATQRPSVNVITGLIKANVPTRMAFRVSSRIDSRTILDQGGAEQLLGQGDMLYLPPGKSMTERVHGAFVADEEVIRIVDDWKKRGEPDFIDGIIDDNAGAGVPGLAPPEGAEDDPEADELYDEAVQFVLQARKASISSVQRKLRIGYNRAARLVEAMEAAGVVSEMGNNGSREVLAPGPQD